MISNKKIAIFGLGKEGTSSANFLGKNNQITIIDDKKKADIGEEFLKDLKAKASFYFGGDLPQDFDFDYVVRSPGAHPNNPTLLKLKESGATITSQTKLFFDLFPGKIIGVTGTKGKGTTATLIHQMLKTQNENVFLAGNIGTPALDILEKSNKDSIAVLELSSFQLFDLTKSPHIAVVLMITSEHLDWHEDETEYKTAKENIIKFQNQSDFAVINNDFKNSKNAAQKTKAKTYFFSTVSQASGAYLENEAVISNVNGKEEIIKAKDIFLPGPHNLQNVLAAACVAKLQNVPNQNIAATLKTFKGLKHRLQLIAEKNGVKYYNDSFSTTPETAIAAINSFKEPKILILGGSSKNSDFTNLGKTIAGDKSVKAIILIGDEGKRIKDAINSVGGFGGKIIEGLTNMQQIVSASKETTQSGDVVLLSPACASFGLFKNYQERGDLFTEEVNSL